MRASHGKQTVIELTALYFNGLDFDALNFAYFNLNPHYKQTANTFSKIAWTSSEWTYITDCHTITDVPMEFSIPSSTLN